MTDRAPEYTVILLGAFRYPGGDASANRLLSLAKTFDAAGCTPLVINDMPPWNGDDVGATIRRHSNVDYMSTGSQNPHKAVRAIQRTTRSIKILRLLRALGLRRGDIHWVVVPSGLYSILLHSIIRLLIGAHPVVDIVERHEPIQFARGRLDPYFIRHRWTCWLAGRLPNQVIVISQTLFTRYAGKKRVLMLPPTVDVHEFRPPSPLRTHLGLNLLYAGAPKGKDQIGVLLRATLALPDLERNRIKVIIAGATREELCRNPDVGPSLVNQMGDTLEALGFVSRDTVLDLLNTSAFTFLIRPMSGFAAAGFPSKIPESLASGCPPILNLTSDLGEYLTDGVDCLVAQTNSLDDVSEVLHRAALLSSVQLQALRLGARATAEARFDFRIWEDTLRKFLVR